MFVTHTFQDGCGSVQRCRTFANFWKKNILVNAASSYATRVDDPNDDNVLAKAVDSGCKTYGKPLQLSNCCNQTISDFGSFLYINCIHLREINFCLTNKTHRVDTRVGRPIFAASIYVKYSLNLCIFFL